jgi:hypothetical protein
MQAELCDIKRAVASGARDAGRRLKTELRRQVASVGIGRRLTQQLRRQALPKPPFCTADGLNCRAGALSAASPSPSAAASCGVEARASGQTSTPRGRMIADRAVDATGSATAGDPVETHALGALAQSRSLLRA